jgi:ferredoxin
MIKKICIVGSGPNGVASIKPFLEHRKKFEITLITRGDFDFEKNTKDKIKHINKLTNSEKYNYWLEKKNSSGFVPKKLFFNSKEIYENRNSEFIFDKNIFFDVSYKIGGLSNVWGANICDLSNNDLKKYGYDNKYLKYFLKKVSKDIKISGEKDKIDNYQNNVCYNKKNLNYTSQAKSLKELFQKNIEFFKNKNFRLGYAKLAINTDDIENACENCGLCMFGCHKNSIYNSANDIKKILQKINFITNTKIKCFDEINNKILLYLENESSQTNSTMIFDKVILAAGTIDTSIIALKYLAKYNKNQLIIKNSNKYFFLYFTKKKIAKDEHKKTIGLSQIFMQTEIKNHTFHLQLYDSNILFKMTLRNFFSTKILNIFFRFFSFIFNRLMVGVIYFPSEISDEMIIEFKNKNFRIKKKTKSSFFIFALLAKLYIFVFKLKSFPLPIFFKGKTGVSQHFGSTLPMSRNPNIGECDINGKLEGTQNIYIADSSSLKRIPSTPPTLLTMSNAQFISSKIIEGMLRQHKKDGR